MNGTGNHYWQWWNGCFCSTQLLMSIFSSCFFLCYNRTVFFFLYILFYLELYPHSFLNFQHLFIISLKINARSLSVYQTRFVFVFYCEILSRNFPKRVTYTRRGKTRRHIVWPAWPVTCKHTSGVIRCYRSKDAEPIMGAAPILIWSSTFLSALLYYSKPSLIRINWGGGSSGLVKQKIALNDTNA
jgi:hypothetical protein